MNEINFQFRKYSISALLISSLILLILILPATCSDYLSNFLGKKSILTMIALIFMWVNMHFSKIISIQVNEDAIRIINVKANKVTVFFNKNIDNYNFNASKKGWLDVLRIKVDKRNTYFWLGGVRFDELIKDRALTKKHLLAELEKAFPTKNKMETIDSIILFAGTKLPYILAAISMAMVLSVLGYIFFFV